MMFQQHPPAPPGTALPKAPTGIVGFDDITHGGLPCGRPTLICGTAGSGKTLFATTFLVNGAVQFDEPGVFMSFEERAADLSANVTSLGYDLDLLVAQRKLVVDYVYIERGEIDEAGEYDLEGLFVRLGCAVDAIGARRVVLDTIEVLFAGLSNVSVVRSELRRLFAWIKDRGLTAVITAERGDGQFTRQGLEEYVSDCVLLVDNRVQDQISTRRLRVVKYRGSTHGTNEYPFLIDEDGISVLPVTAAGLAQGVSNEIIASGVPGLDAMLGEGGFYRGSSILFSGVAGAGKTTLSALFADAACTRGERVLFSLFEESAAQMCRNASSVGLDLQRHVDTGRLNFEAARPSLYGLETHLARMHRDLIRLAPDVVVIDPISALHGPTAEVQATLLRVIDMLKSRGITAVFTSFQDQGDALSMVNQELSSLMDAWIRLMDVESNGERNRALYVIKARGMRHSNQVREYRMSESGVTLIEPYIGPEGVLTGTARATQIAREQAVSLRRRQDADQRKRELRRRREAMEHEIADMRAAVDTEEADVHTLLSEDSAREAAVADDRAVDVGLRSSAA
jgi:circadian clock protein KaiC